MLWRIQVKDLTGDASGYFPRVVIGPPGSSERITSGTIVEASPGDYFSTHATASPVEGEWIHEGERHTFDGLFAVEVIPGTYEWFQFKLDEKNIGIGSSVAVLTLPLPVPHATLWASSVSAEVQTDAREPAARDRRSHTRGWSGQCSRRRGRGRRRRPSPPTPRSGGVRVGGGPGRCQRAGCPSPSFRVHPVGLVPFPTARSRSPSPSQSPHATLYV